MAAMNTPTTDTPVQFDGATGKMLGKAVSHSVKKLKDLSGVFSDTNAFEQAAREDREKIVYRVQSYQPVKDNTPGGLFFGVSTICPGMVGDEYYMTRGHFHARRECAEFYWGIQGEGLLVFMRENRTWWTERVVAGSLHYIAGHVAHRLVNTKSAKLVVGACWSSDAGHDYQSIERKGFSVRVMQGVNGYVCAEQ